MGAISCMSAGSNWVGELTVALDSRSDSMAQMHHDPISMPEGNGFGAESIAYVLVRWIQFIALLLTIGAVSFHTFVLAAIRRNSRTANEATEAGLLPRVEARAARVGHIAAWTARVQSASSAEYCVARSTSTSANEMREAPLPVTAS